MPDSPMPQPSSPDSEITAPRPSTALRVLKRLLAVFVIAGIGVWGLHWYATGGAGKKDSSAKTNEASVPVDVAAAQKVRRRSLVPARAGMQEASGRRVPDSALRTADDLVAFAVGSSTVVAVGDDVSDRDWLGPLVLECGHLIGERLFSDAISGAHDSIDGASADRHAFDDLLREQLFTGGS